MGAAAAGGRRVQDNSARPSASHALRPEGRAPNQLVDAPPPIAHVPGNQQPLLFSSTLDVRGFTPVLISASPITGYGRVQKKFITERWNISFLR